MLCCIVLASCDNTPTADNSQQSADNSQQLIFSHNPLDPGSTSEPSNDVSRKLFEMDGQERLAIFKEYMNSSGKACEYVTEAVLLGGYQRTDFWRVACSDSGEWEVSIEPDSEGSTRILSCNVVKALARLEKHPGDDCHAVWNRVKVNRRHSH